MRAVGVQVLPRLIGLHHDGLGPVEEIRTGGAGDRPHPVVHDAVVTGVLLLGGRPERDVLRVERAVGDHRLVLHLGPMDAVGRREGAQAGQAVTSDHFGTLRRCLPSRPVRFFVGILQTAEAFVTLIGGHAGTLVDERAEIVIDDQPFVEHDIPLRELGQLVESQVGFRPAITVAALGVQGHFLVVVARPAVAPIGAGNFVAAIVQAVQLAILDDGRVVPGRPSRVSVPRQPLRFVQLQPSPLQFADQQFVHEQLAARPDLDRRGFGRLDKHAQRDESQRRQRWRESTCPHFDDLAVVGRTRCIGTTIPPDARSGNSPQQMPAPHGFRSPASLRSASGAGGRRKPNDPPGEPAGLGAGAPQAVARRRTHHWRVVWSFAVVA